jgi:hypothetical protein
MSKGTSTIPPMNLLEKLRSMYDENPYGSKRFSENGTRCSYCAQLRGKGHAELCVWHVTQQAISHIERLESIISAERSADEQWRQFGPLNAPGVREHESRMPSRQ